MKTYYSTNGMTNLCKYCYLNGKVRFCFPDHLRAQRVIDTIIECQDFIAKSFNVMGSKIQVKSVPMNINQDHLPAQLLIYIKQVFRLNRMNGARGAANRWSFFENFINRAGLITGRSSNAYKHYSILPSRLF